MGEDAGERKSTQLSISEQQSIAFERRIDTAAAQDFLNELSKEFDISDEALKKRLEKLQYSVQVRMLELATAETRDRDEQLIRILESLVQGSDK